MPRRKKQAEEGDTNEGEDQTEKRLPSHAAPETHLSEAQRESAPGGDGMGLEHEGTAHAGAIAGGMLGQQVGLPTPLPAKEAKEAGFASPAQEDELKAKEEKEKPEGGEEGGKTEEE